MKLQMARAVNEFNVQLRTSNIEGATHCLFLNKRITLMTRSINLNLRRTQASRISKERFAPVLHSYYSEWACSGFIKLTGYNIRSWMFNVRYSLFDIRHSLFYSHILNGIWRFNVQHHRPSLTEGFGCQCSDFRI